jgi:threonine dehydrogenase-like Zn-dependent dehydrogenase
VRRHHAHGAGPLSWYDGLKQKARLETGRPHALREAIQSCRKGGVVSIPGVFGGLIDRVPLRDAPAMYRTFRDKEDDCVKVVLTP